MPSAAKLLLALLLSASVVGLSGCAPLVGVRYYDGPSKVGGPIAAKAGKPTLPPLPGMPALAGVQQGHSLPNPLAGLFARLAHRPHLEPVEDPGVVAPHSRFHPVPTRPIFEAPLPPYGPQPVPPNG